MIIREMKHLGQWKLDCYRSMFAGKLVYWQAIDLWLTEWKLSLYLILFLLIFPPGFIQNHFQQKLRPKMSFVGVPALSCRSAQQCSALVSQRSAAAISVKESNGTFISTLNLMLYNVSKSPHHAHHDGKLWTLRWQNWRYSNICGWFTVGLDLIVGCFYNILLLSGFEWKCIAV